jgi:Fe2+ transport system protein B
MALSYLAFGLLSSALELISDWQIANSKSDQAERVLRDVSELLSFPTTITWALSSLVMNTLLSLAIITKIVYVCFSLTIRMI